MGSKIFDENQWHQTTWGEIVELRYGKALKDYQNSQAEFPVYGTNGPVGFSDIALCPHPSVIVGRKGAYRGIHFSDTSFFVIDTAFYINPLIDINLKWAYYHLLTQDINGLDSGSAIPSTRREDFYALPVNIPPRWIQDEIANKLDSFERKITLNRQINQTLEQMAQTLFKSWFVDFDPVIDNALDAGNAIPDTLQERAEQRRLLRAKTDFKPLPAETRALFPSEFEETELGWVPKGWEAGSLNSVASYTSGRVDISELNLNNYISTENMLSDRQGICSASSLPTVQTVPSYSTGHILISNIRPYFKKIWFAHGTGGRSNDVLGFSANQAGTEDYLYNLLYQDVFFDFMMITSKGSKMPRGDKEAIMSWPLIIPPLSLRQFYSKQCASARSKKELSKAENEILAEMRDTLLPKLISGELALDDLPEDITEVVEAV